MFADAEVCVKNKAAEYLVGCAVSCIFLSLYMGCVAVFRKKMIWIGEISILLSMAIMAPFIKLILGLYQAPADTIGDIYKLLVIIMLPMVLFWSTSNVLPNVLRAARDVKFTSYVSLAVMWVVRVGLSYLVSIKLGMGIEGVWLCICME